MTLIVLFLLLINLFKFFFSVLAIYTYFSEILHSYHAFSLHYFVITLSTQNNFSHNDNSVETRKLGIFDI